MATAWTMFVKKIYKEGKAKNPNYEFKQALVDASKRKAEMGSRASLKSSNKSKKMSLSGGRRKSRRTRRRH